MAWNLTLFAITVLALFVNVGLEAALPPIQAEAFAEDIAPRLGVNEELLRTELTHALSRGEARRMVVRGLPLCLLAALLAMRLIAGKKGIREPR